MTTTAKVTVTEETFSCSDGMKLATRRWTNFSNANDHDQLPRRTRKILCLHGWLDNAASFNRLAPLLLDSSFSSPEATKIPTEIVALDFPGHGLSSHKSVDGPPQLLAEYVYYVAELIEALQWGKGDEGGTGTGVGDSRTVVGNIHSNAKHGDGGGVNTEKSSDNVGDNTNTDENRILLIGHSMGSGVSVILCAAFPEWFFSLVCLEGGLIARNANDASRHVRAACQRRLKSNRTLFPNSNNESGSYGETTSPRAKIYGNLEQAIEARLSTTRRMPGDQFLSYEAARDMVLRATVPANAVSSSSHRADSEAVVFRHDPRLQWPSLQYYTREQVEAFFRDVNTSNIPVCFLSAADGWPSESWAESVIKDVLKPRHIKRLSGSHHFHADSDSVEAVVDEIFKFLEEHKL